jgi:hypothetical protein
MSETGYLDRFPEEVRKKFQEIADRFGITSDLPSETLDGLILTAFYKNPEVVILANGRIVDEGVEEMVVKVEGETPKAYRLKMVHSKKNPMTNNWEQETHTVFLPKSQCRLISSFIEVPRWLAEKHFSIMKLWHLTLRAAFGYYISEFQISAP